MSPGTAVVPHKSCFRRGGAGLDITGDSGETGRTTLAQPYPRTGRVPIRTRTPRGTIADPVWLPVRATVAGLLETAWLA
jgi:hypothetical protein